MLFSEKIFIALLSDLVSRLYYTKHTCTASGWSIHKISGSSMFTIEEGERQRENAESDGNVYCTVLCCIVLHCFVSYCIVLFYCIVFKYCIVLYYHTIQYNI